MDLDAELPDRDECQDVESGTDSRSVGGACAAAGACSTVTSAGSKSECLPPPLTPSLTARLASMHDRRQCREGGRVDTDCCAGIGKGSCAAGYTPMNTGEACYDGLHQLYESYHCVPASAYPQCDTETPWVERNHCSWDGRCDSDVANTEPDSGGYFCHGSEESCRGPCTVRGQYTGTWCPGLPPPPPPPPEGQCPPGCTYTPPLLRCDSEVLRSDPLEVGKSTILKNDHGPGGVWPASCGAGSCADGFERKEPSCSGCENDFLKRNNPEDFPDCDCDDVPQLDALFATLHSGDKRAVQSAINMTSVFSYQGFAVLVSNGDTGSHNYYMSKVVGEPWRIINVDPDWSFGYRITFPVSCTASRLAFAAAGAALPCCAPPGAALTSGCLL